MLVFDDGTSTSVTASMLSRTLMRQEIAIVGTDGTMHVDDQPYTLHCGGRITLIKDGDAPEGVTYQPQPNTYQYQLQAFAAAINGTEINRTPVSEAVRIMSLIDEIYLAAGLCPRPSRLDLRDERTA
jgi:predicted dehydrogenase